MRLSDCCHERVCCSVTCVLQDLMRTACDVTNVVEAANTDGRQERLENMLVQLEQCQKALQVGAAIITG